MKNIIALVLRLLVDTVLGLGLYAILCGLCAMFFDTAGNFKVWFALIAVLYAISIYAQDISSFIEHCHRRRK